VLKKVLSLAMSVILIVATVSFAISFNSTPVLAADEDTGCCVLDDNDNYCSSDATEDQCEGSFYSGISCSEVSGQGNIPGPCEKVSCLEEDGSCSARKYFRQCIDGGGAWDTKQISEITSCQPGCCQILDENNDVIEQKQVTFGLQCEQDANILGLGSNFVPGQCEVLEEQLKQLSYSFSLMITLSLI